MLKHDQEDQPATKQVNFRWPASVKEDLDRFAKQSGLSRNFLSELAIRKFLETPVATVDLSEYKTLSKTDDVKTA